MVPVRAAKALGLDCARPLAECGIELEVADPRAAWYPYAAAQALWTKLAEAAGDATFGLTAAALQNDDPTSWGVLEYVARNSHDFRDALGRIARYGQLMHDHATVELREDPAGAFFTYRIPELAGPNRYAAQWAAAAWVLRGRKLVGAAFDPLEVTFRHAAPSDVELGAYQQVFRCPLRFGRPETGVLVSHANLARPIVGADVALLAVVDAHAKELVERLPGKTLDSQVRSYLTRALSTGGDSSLAAIGRALALSTRTLQRRLQDDGLSHRDMVDEIRCELARRMVTNTSLSNNEMAFLLGFAEAPAFLRAFKRWVGQSPGELRGKRGAT